MPDLTQLSSHSGIPRPVLVQISAAAKKYAQRVVLYGSRARGDHHPESDIDIAFNVRYMQDVVRTMDCEKIILNFNDSLSPCVITPENDLDYVHLVLPVRTAG